jgi:hypothetical protein
MAKNGGGCVRGVREVKFDQNRSEQEDNYDSEATTDIDEHEEKQSSQKRKKSKRGKGSLLKFTKCKELVEKVLKQKGFGNNVKLTSKEIKLMMLQMHDEMKDWVARTCEFMMRQHPNVKTIACKHLEQTQENCWKKTDCGLLAQECSQDLSYKTCIEKMHTQVNIPGNHVSRMALSARPYLRDACVYRVGNYIDTYIRDRTNHVSCAR